MEENEFNYINMVPFIDVMLVLLTIVLLTSTFVVSGVIPVQLPKVTSKHDQMVKNITVEIDKEGGIYYGGKAVVLYDLKGKIRGFDSETPFLIRADNRVPLQRFVDVLDLIKGAGFTRVSVQTEQTR